MRPSDRLRPGWRLICLVAVLISGCARSVNGPTAAATATPTAAVSRLKSVRVQTPEFGMDQVPWRIAQEKGLFAKHGVSVQLDVMNPQAAIPALLGGKVDFISIGGTALRAAWTGLPIRMVLGVDVHPQFLLVARPGIKSIAALRGKSIGTNAPTSSLSQIVFAALRPQGLQLKDYTLVGLGPDAQRLGALEAGTVSAAIMDPAPARQAIEAGMHELLNVGAVVNVPASALATTTTFIKEHPGRIRDMIAGTFDGITWMRRHPAAAQALIAKWFKLSPALAKAAFLAGMKSYTRSGVVSERGVRTVLAIGQVFESTFGAKGSSSYPNVPARLTPAQMKRLVDFQFAASGR